MNAIWSWIKSLFNKQPAAVEVPPAPKPVAPPVASSTSAPTGAYLKGGDFSRYQTTVDAVLYPKTHDYFITKATDGLGSVDSYFRAGREEAHKMGLPFLGYHFFRFADVSPAGQAKALYAAFGALQKGEAVAADYEWDNKSSVSARYGDGRETDKAGNDLFYTFKEEAEQLFGQPLIIYTGRSFMPMVDERFSKNPLWVFDYHTTDRATPKPGQRPILPPSWNDWAFWQFSDREQTPGSGAIDMNVFSGSLDDLRKICKQ